MGHTNADASDEAAKSANLWRTVGNIDEDGEDFLRQIVTGDES